MPGLTSVTSGPNADLQAPIAWPDTISPSQPAASISRPRSTTYSSARNSGRPKFAGVRLDNSGTMRNRGNRFSPRAARPAARLCRVNTSSRLSASVTNRIPSAAAWSTKSLIVLLMSPAILRSTNAALLRSCSLLRSP